MLHNPNPPLHTHASHCTSPFTNLRLHSVHSPESTPSLRCKQVSSMTGEYVPHRLMSPHPQLYHEEANSVPLNPLPTLTESKAGAISDFKLGGIASPVTSSRSPVALVEAGLSFFQVPAPARSLRVQNGVTLIQVLHLHVNCAFRTSFPSKSLHLHVDSAYKTSTFSGFGVKWSPVVGDCLHFLPSARKKTGLACGSSPELDCTRLGRTVTEFGVNVT